MNYIKIYNDLMMRAKNRKLTGYTEKHHIIPKCLGGTNDKSNLVQLTAREHYIAHQLLVNIHPQHHGLKYAAYMMTISPTGQRSNNRLYQWLKESYFENRVQSSGFTGRTHSEETKEKMRQARALQAPMSDETKSQISITKTGVKFTPSAKESFNKKRMENPEWYNSIWGGRPKSAETKAKIGKANKGRKFPTVICPHCNKEGAGPNMTRYHLDNCKSKTRPN